VLGLRHYGTDQEDHDRAVRDRRILRMWAEGVGQQTMAIWEGTSRERIRQIAAKKVRQLRHPSRVHEREQFLALYPHLLPVIYGPRDAEKGAMIMARRMYRQRTQPC
jgi:hypothetical protein